MFQFKEFQVEDHLSTMKVGTDAMLLGSWVDTTYCNRMLDVGTGSGVIAMMLAQRCTGQIDAIELDQDSARQAAENFKHAPWKKNLYIYHGDFNEYVKQTANIYDGIVCNPPFFFNSLKSEKYRNNLARHQNTLSFSQLVSGARKLLKSHGKFSVIIPFMALDGFSDLILYNEMYISRQTLVFPKPNSEPVRCLLEARFFVADEKTKNRKNDTLILRNPMNKYTTQYLQLTEVYHKKNPAEPGKTN